MQFFEIFGFSSLKLSQIHTLPRQLASSPSTAANSSSGGGDPNGNGGSSSSSSSSTYPSSSLPCEPASCPREVRDLMSECWRRDERRRPAFREIHLFLRRKSLGYVPPSQI